jgi:two-component system OmpR family response regulator
MAKTIAIVEDEPTLASNYRDLFEQDGFRVAHYPNRKTAEEGILDEHPHLIILDVGLDDERDGGFQLLRKLRDSAPTIPIIFLTHRDSDFDKVAGLHLGADDYLTKDIGLEHLRVRVRNLIQRFEILAQGHSDASDEILVGKLRINDKSLQVWWQDQLVDLKVPEFYLVKALAERPGHVKSKDALMYAANMTVDDATITSYIKRIRGKFEQLDPDFSAIETIYAQGYRWRS